MAEQELRDWREAGIGLTASLFIVVVPVLYDLIFTPDDKLGILFLFTFTFIPLWNMIALAAAVSLRRTRGWGLLIGVLVGMILTALFLFTPIGFLPGILLSAITGQ